MGLGKDPRPANLAEIIKKYRKVIPEPLPPSGDAGFRKSGSSSRTALDSGLDPYTDEWTSQQAAHLLRRLLFGVKKSELDYFTGMSMEQAVDELIQTSPIPDPPVNDYNYSLEAGVEDNEIADGETFIEAPWDDDLESPRIISLKAWMVKNFLHQETTIHEKMILFWHNLLVTEMWGIFISKGSYQYFDMLRTHALGNYKTLIRELTLNPVMLLYLNGTLNNKEAPDENYARELQELFCIGKGPGSNYTEEDVQAAARVLTGWVTHWDDVTSEGVMKTQFYPHLHETANKQFSAFYGNRVITGRSGVGGALELDDLLDMIFDNNETALYICRRLYNFFVYHEIDEQTEENVIQPLAQVFRENNYGMVPVLKTLFKSEHFFDPENRGVLIKNPVDYLIGSMRTLDVEKNISEDTSIARNTYGSIHWSMSELGMEIGDPPNVSGWPAYYQAPQFDKAWISTNTVPSRAIKTDSLIFWGFWVDETNRLFADLTEFVKSLDNPSDPDLMIEEAVQLLTGVSLSEDTHAFLKKTLLSGQASDHYWTQAWNNFDYDPENEQYRQVVETRLKAMFQQLTQLAEFQLM